MNWTQRQLQAIEERNKNILVSAAAGSGKTAVLVERILCLILEEKIDVDKLLVVTFTNAAASEMKAKITEAIKKRIKEEPEESVFLRRQLSNMYKTSISTFHSFAKDIIKRYFYVIDLDPNLVTADETQTVIMRNAAMDRLFEKGFNEKDEEFLEFINLYGASRNEDSLKEALMNLYNRIMAMPEPFKWLEKSAEKTESYVGYKNMHIYKLMINDVGKYMKKAFKAKKNIVDILSYAGAEKMAAKQANDVKFVVEVIKLLEEERLEEALAAISGFKAAQLRASGEEKEAYEEVKEVVSVFKDDFSNSISYVKDIYLQESLDIQFQRVAATAPYAKKAAALIKDFSQMYKQDKLDKGIMDFNDMEHYAMEILKNDEVAEECRKKYEYIFIDEYQDSNFLQEAIISRIKRENNLFMVGDVKQSIYSFRQAEPDIFKEKYYGYAQDGKLSEKIDLNMNFRSKSKIIESINSVFENIMEGYDEDATLYTGAESPEEYDFPVELMLIDKSSVAEIKEESEEGELLAEMKDTQLEALAAVKKIKEIVGTSFYDHKTGEVRTIKYRDIVVLMRSIKSKGEKFAEILEKNGIPVFLDSSTGYFENIELALIMNLLRIIDNGKRDIPLLGVLNSHVFGFDIDELIEIRLENPKGPFYKAFENYSKSGKNEDIKEKCQKTLETIKIWKDKSKYTKIEEFVWNLMMESGIYVHAGTMRGGRQRQLNLRTFADKAAVYANTGESSIYGLIRYFENLKSQVEVGQTSLLSEEDDTVRITTIHKSKGLEYPVVIVPSMASRFTYDNVADVGFSHRKVGFAMTYVDTKGKGIYNTILQRIIESIKKRESDEEEIRVLYVAMTRAKDRLIMLGTVKDAESYGIRMENSLTGRKCFLDYVYPYVGKGTNSSKIILDAGALTEHVTEESTGTSYKKEKIREFLNGVESIKTDRSDEIIRALEYKYPYEYMFNVKSKYSVSELGKKQKPVYFKTSFDNETNEANNLLTGAKRGTAYHRVMEHLDFKKALEEGKTYISKALDSLVKREILTEDEALFIDINTVNSFFESEIGKRAAVANPVLEESFIMKYNIDGADTIVQGTIDCYFEENGEIVLIDYKTNRSTKRIEELYREQINLYKEALEKSTGKKVKEGWLYLFEENRGIKIS